MKQQSADQADRSVVPDPITSRNEELLLKEAEQLRNLYLESVKEIGALERYALIATGGIWTWGVTNSDATYVPLLAWIPLVLQLLFGLRTFGIYREMVWIWDYVSAIERAMETPKHLGWGSQKQKRKRGLRIVTGFAFWIVLPLVTILVAVLARRLPANVI